MDCRGPPAQAAQGELCEEIGKGYFFFNTFTGCSGANLAASLVGFCQVWGHQKILDNSSSP